MDLTNRRALVWEFRRQLVDIERQAKPPSQGFIFLVSGMAMLVGERTLPSQQNCSEICYRGKAEEMRRSGTEGNETRFRSGCLRFLRTNPHTYE